MEAVRKGQAIVVTRFNGLPFALSSQGRNDNLKLNFKM